MKTCSKCQRNLPYECFQKDRAIISGWRSRCKECCKSGQYRHRRTSKYAQWRDSRNANPETKERIKSQSAARYRRNREKRLEQCRARRRTTKGRAKEILMTAVRAGEIERPEICELCQGGGNIEAHHWDYNEPLEIQWLCLPCHRRIHGALKTYKRMVAA